MSKRDSAWNMHDVGWRRRRDSVWGMNDIGWR
jgi:hypothetical protein